jgi:hypothetical protein
LLARRYLVTLIREREMDIAEWPFDQGMPAGLAPIFLDELLRIADRIEATIPDRHRDRRALQRPRTT